MVYWHVMFVVHVLVVAFDVYFFPFKSGVRRA